MKPVNLDRETWAWVALAASFLAAVDGLSAGRVNIGVLYVGLVLISLWSRRRSFVVVAAVVSTCLVLIGFFRHSPTAANFVTDGINRLLAIAAVWMTVVLSMTRQRSLTKETVADLQKEHSRLEDVAHRKTRKLLEQQSENLAATQDASFYVMAKMAEARDSDTGQHIDRVRAYCHVLATEIRKNPAYANVIDDRFLADLYRCSPLHDLGKIAIPDAILLKPGRLTSDEFELMQTHALVGSRILEDAVRRKHGADFLDMAIAIAKCHHERFDGSGYPAGLSGRSIPLVARIVALADVFDALTSERPYKEAFPPEYARQIILSESGRHFDPMVVEAFERRFDDFVRIRERFPNKHTRIFGITDTLVAETTGQAPVATASQVG